MGYASISDRNCRPSVLKTNVHKLAHSSSGLGHLPLKEEITGSNPVCATNSTIIALPF